MTVLRSGSATDVGRVRKVNQDLPLEASNLFAVADGMGGHVGGEVAAKVAVDALLQVFSREPTKAGLEDAFSKANRAVWQESLDHRELRGMGTTLTAVALVGDNEGRDTLALANVGDSRAYLFSGGRLVQISADHSVAEERMRHGEITEEEAAVHPQRHILTRALGISSEVETDMWELQLRPGDRVMLCSDGLSNELSNEQMANVLATELDPIEAAHQLVLLANEHGGSDNITVIVVDVLVGEETAAASVITPIGERAGPPLIVVPDSDPDGRAGAAGATGAAATAGATLTGRFPAVQVEGSGPGDLLLDQTQAVPVARATVRSAAVAPLPPSAVVPPNESRGARRRRLGIPRRVTPRVVLFVVLVAAVPTAAFFAIRWYAYDNWFIAIQKSQIVIKQGHPGGVLWFHPRVVDKTKVTTSKILSGGADQIRVGGVQEPSLQAAKRYVANLHDEYLKAAAAKKASQQRASSSTTTTFPGAAGTPTGTTGTTTTVVSGATSPTATPATPATATLTPAETSTTPTSAANAANSPA